MLDMHRFCLRLCVTVLAVAACGESTSPRTPVAVVYDVAGEWNFTEQYGGTYRGTPVMCSDTGSYQFTQNHDSVAGTSTQVGTCIGELLSQDVASILSDSVTDGLLSTRHLEFDVGGCRYAGDVTPDNQLSGTVSCGDWTGSWEAVHGGAPVAAVAVRWDVQTVVGGVVQLVAVPQDAAGHVLARDVTWSSDKPSVAAVSNDGLVSVLAPGPAHITATSEGKSGSATVAGELVSFASVSAGLYHSCAVTTTGSAYCWGWGGDGQLGTGFRPPAKAPSASAQTPVAVAGGHTFAMVAAGDGRSCGVTTSGEALCWGENYYGQLGDGSKTSSLVPVPVAGGREFASVTLGALHACGLTTTNAVYCWANNSQGQLGVGSKGGPSSSPLLVAGNLQFQSVRAGASHTCGVTTAGAAYCWGYNLDGQIGDGTVGSAVTTPEAVAGDHSFVAVAAGIDHSCGLTPEGAAYCWGDNYNGQLGDGSKTSSLVPVPIAGGLAFATSGGAISAGQESSCALTAAGAAHCWGYNDLGEIGDGTTIARATPAPVSGGLRFASISVGAFHTCGVTSTAVAFCWGNNGNGQLGTATVQTCPISGDKLPCATSPVRVTGTIQVAASVARAAVLDAREQAAPSSALLRMLQPGVPGREPRVPRRQ